MTAPNHHRLGAHVEPGGVRFTAFARASSCSVALTDANGELLHSIEMEALGGGYFSTQATGIGHGALYFFVVDGRRLTDPYARFLPQGVHGPAMVTVPSYAFLHLPPQRALAAQVIYELHVGTFTEQGTFEAARHKLPALAELGITTIELMPVAAFAGERGWGYDGVALFAPHAAYGTPDQLRELVDAAHGLGLLVLLDVVYNHFGPAGNYLEAYSPAYFSQELHTAWGKAPNFAEPAMRELVLDNARYWLREVGFDGLRLDATHALLDSSPRHILSELAQVAHELGPRQLVIAEDERNHAELVSSYGLDAVWADDFHHQLRVSLTRERAGYFAAYEPSARGVADTINQGWLYVGQPSPLRGEARGTLAQQLPAEAFVYCIQNHDQVGNRALGERLSASVSAEAFRAASLLLLFLPMTPLLFMGQEWGAATPFLYFSDHEPELGRLVSEGRRREFADFPEFADELGQARIPDPQSPATFHASKLHWAERDLPEHAATLELYRAALALRREDPVLSRAGRHELLARAQGDTLLVERWLGRQRRVLILNLGDAEVALPSLVDGLELRSAELLLQSSPLRAGRLSPKQAVVCAGVKEVAAWSEAST